VFDAITYVGINLQDCGTDCAKFQKSELEYKFNKRALERPYTFKQSWGKTYGRHTVTTSITWSSVMNSIESSRNMGVGIFFTTSGMDEVRGYSMINVY
jgi:sialic acid synthase